MLSRRRRVVTRFGRESARVREACQRTIETVATLRRGSWDVRILRGLSPTRDRLLQVLPNRGARQTQLRGPPPAGPPLYQHFVSNDMHLIHPEHPLANPGSLDYDSTF